MEVCKAHLPELVHSRIEDLVNVQTVDEEMAVHMKELEARLAALEALAREDAAEEARLLVEDVERLFDRIRRDYVAIAYRQGLVDGAGVKKLVAGQDEPLAL
ncbi:hypothetical protein [Solidesulfovibrio sp.]